MKNRKKKRVQLNEDRNALYHKVITHNIELANKNSQLSEKNNVLERDLKNVYTPWYRFWTLFKYIKLRA